MKIIKYIVPLLACVVAYQMVTLYGARKKESRVIAPTQPTPRPLMRLSFPPEIAARLAQNELQLKERIEIQLNDPTISPFVAIALAYKILVDANKESPLPYETVFDFRRAIEELLLMDLLRPHQRQGAHRLSALAAINYLIFYLGSDEETVELTNHIQNAYALNPKHRRQVDLVNMVWDPKMKEEVLRKREGYEAYYQINIEE